MRIIRWSLVSLFVLLLSITIMKPAAEASTRLFVEDQEIELQESTVFIENDRLYVPVRFVVEQLGAHVGWKQSTQEIMIMTTDREKFLFQIGEAKLIWNQQTYPLDVSPLLVEDRTYMPARHVAEWLHMKVSWSAENSSVRFNKVAPAFVEKEMSWKELGQALGVAPKSLQERNPQVAENPEAGDLIKQIIPQSLEVAAEAEEPTDTTAKPVAVIEEPDSQELDLLARIIHAEAGYEKYAGQVAVGNVIMNRIADSRFPDTLQEVIYQPGQFTPAQNGSLERIIPDESSIKAAKEVLAGEVLVEDALFFYNPYVSTSSFFDSLEFVVDIGNHRFLK